MKVYTYFNKQRKRDDGAIPIYIVVYRPPKRMFIHTGLFSKVEFEDCVFPRSESNHKAKSILLSQYMDGVEKIALENSMLPFDEMKAMILDKVFGKSTVNDNLVALLREYGNKAKGKRTKEIYEATAIKVESFDSNASLNISYKWLERFLQSERDAGNADNSTAIHLRNIRAIFNWSMKNEWTENYPFRHFSIPSSPTRKRNLSVDTLRYVFDCDVKPHIERYRDLFKLMFFLIGVNGVDLLTAKKNQIRDGRFEYIRAKTGKQYSVKIEPEAQEILDRYQGKDYLLNFCDTASYRSIMAKADKFLKEIVPEISTYWSRHSWATIASEIDIPIDTISAALGHSHGSEITNIYINFDQKKVDAANRKVIDYVLGIGEDDESSPTLA